MNRILPPSIALLLSILSARGGEAVAEYNFPGWGDTRSLAGPIEDGANETFADQGVDASVEVSAAGTDKLRAEYTFADSDFSCAEFEANIDIINASFEGVGTATIISCSSGSDTNTSSNRENVLGSEIEAGTGWFWSKWLEAYQAESFPWIWTEKHGWWWIDGSDDEEIYAYSLDRGLWLYTGSDLFPWAYDWSAGEWRDLSQD